MINCGEDEEYLERKLASVRKIKGCEHEFYERSWGGFTTGPDVILKCCRKCDYREEVGVYGSKGKVYYDKEDELDRSALEKAMGCLSAEELERVMRLNGYHFYRLKSEIDAKAKRV